MHPFNQALVLSLSLFLFIQNVVAIDDPFIISSCSTTNSFSATDKFGQNVAQLMSRLATLSHRNNGYANYSVGNGLDKVNGLALCRGDLNITACKSCVRDAVVEIRKQCPLNKQAFVYFDKCHVRYSDKEFFGQIDEDDTFSAWNVESVSSIFPPEQFNALVTQLMASLKETASSSPLLYASSTVKIGSTSEILYGLVQCTQDLSGEVCKKCLESNIAGLPGCCRDKKGGRVGGGSCNVRYEMYPFFNIAATYYNKVV